MTEGDRSVPEENRRRGATRNVAEALVIYAGIPALIMYPLGLLVLWLQISYSYGETLAASWVAANLVPRTALMGIGFAAIWDLLTQWTSLAGLGLIALFIALLARRMGRAQDGGEPLTRIEELGDASIEELKEELNRRTRELDRLKEEREKLTEERQHALHIPLIDIYWLGPRWALGLLALFFLLQVVGWLLLALQGRWSEAVSQALFLTSTLAGVYILARDGYEAEHGRLSKYRWFLRGLSVAFVGVLCAAVLESGIQPPVLPEVLLDTRDGPTEAALLAHEGGYWYLFDQDNSFRAIPDDETGEVQFIEPRGV